MDQHNLHTLRSLQIAYKRPWRHLQYEQEFKALASQTKLVVKDSACVTEVQLHGIFTIMLIARFTIFIMFLNEEDSRPEGKPKVKFND